MAYDAGTAVLQVVPSFDDVEGMIARGARDMVKGLDKALGDRLGAAFDKAGKDAKAPAARTAKILGRTFADGAMREVNNALASIGESDKILAPLRKELVELSKVDLGRGFDEKGFIARIGRVAEALRKAQQDATGINMVGRFTNAGNAATALGRVQDIVKAARQRGFEAGDAFGNAYAARLAAVRAALPDLRVTTASSDDERRTAAVRARVEAAQRVRVGDVATAEANPLNLRIGTRVDAAILRQEMAILEGLLDNLVEQAAQVELVVAADKARAQVGGFFEDTKTQAQKAAEAQAQAFLKAWDDALKEQDRRDRVAREAMSRAYDDAVAEQVKRDRQAREQMARLYDDAVKEDFRRRKRALADYNAAYDAAVKEQYQRDKKALRDFQRDLDAAYAENLRRQRALDAARFDRSTAGRVQAGTRQAVEDLPLTVVANDASVEAAMADIRSKVAALGDLRVGMDINSSEFANKVETEFRRLKALASNQSIEVEIRADAARAASQLGGVLVMLNRISSADATVQVRADTDRATAGLQGLLSSLSLNLGRLGALIALGSSLGSAIVPAAAAAASAIGFIGTAALAAGAGLGVTLLAFSGIGDAVQAMSRYSDDQAQSNASVARSADQIAAALDQVRSAEMALRNTRENNRVAAIRAQQAIQDAVEDVRDAVRDAARDQQDAVERISDAQRDLSRAEEDSRRTREGLTEAYRDALRAIDDLNSSIRGNALDQRQATLDIAEAKAALEQVMTNPRATETEREQARITYEQRKLQLEDLRRKAGQMEEEQNKAWIDGARGSEQVVRARQAIIDADERRSDAARALGRAQQDAQDSRRNGIDRIRDAQKREADARFAALDQQRQAAYSLFTATQSVVAAQRALRGAYTTTSTAGSAALDTLNDKMAKLSPTAQAFARYLFGLRGAFAAARRAADPAIAGMQRAMELLIGKNSADAQQKLKPLFTFINDVARAMGDIFVRFAQTLKGPTFTRFFNYMARTAVPTLNNMYTAFENVLLGVTNLFLAFTPLTGDVERGFVGLTEKFRIWSETLDSNTGFQNFLAYLRQSGPAVGRLLLEMAKAIGSLVVAAAPVGAIVIRGFTALFEMINKIPEKTLASLVAGIGAASAAIALFAGVTSLVALGTAGAVAAAVGALVLAFSVLVGSSDTVRQALGDAWAVVKDGAVVAFETMREVVQRVWTVLRPLWADFIDVVLDLYRSAFVPAFRGIKAVALNLYQNLKPLLGLVVELLKFVGQIVLWLYKYAFLPALKAIALVIRTVLVPVITWLWRFIVKPIFNSIGLAIRAVLEVLKVVVGGIRIQIAAWGTAFTHLYTKYIKPFWEKNLRPLLQTMGEWIGKHVKPKWDVAITALGKAWGRLKSLLGEPVKFIVETVLNNGILRGYNVLADKFGVEPKNVRIDPPPGGWYATGGPIRGPGTGTSDSVLIRASRGEHMLTAAEVQAAGGHQAIYALRREIRQRRQLPGFAKGGAILAADEDESWFRRVLGKARGVGKTLVGGVSSFLSDPLGSLRKVLENLSKQVPDTGGIMRKVAMAIPGKVLTGLLDKITGVLGVGGPGGSAGPLGAGGGPGGWQWQMSVLRQVFPGLRLISGYRSGSRTLSGKLSRHARGLAVDLDPIRAVAEWIARTFGAKSHELITPWRDLMLYKGRPHKFSRAIEAQHGVFGNNAHIHWSYDKGGQIPDTRRMPGQVMQVFHGRRTPDKVLTDAQWQSMSTLAAKARESMRAGDTIYHFKDHTLDMDRLRAETARRNALERVGRPNW